MYRLDMSTYNISTWTHNTVYIYILERERLRCVFTFIPQSSSRIPSHRIIAGSFEELHKGSAPVVHSHISGSQRSEFPDQTSHYNTTDHLCDVCDVKLDQFGQMVPKVLQLSQLSELSGPWTPDTLARE